MRVALSVIAKTRLRGQAPNYNALTRVSRQVHEDTKGLIFKMNMICFDDLGDFRKFQENAGSRIFSSIHTIVLMESPHLMERTLRSLCINATDLKHIRFQMLLYEWTAAQDSTLSEDGDPEDWASNDDLGPDDIDFLNETKQEVDKKQAIYFMATGRRMRRLASEIRSLSSELRFEIFPIENRLEKIKDHLPSKELILAQHWVEYSI